MSRRGIVSWIWTTHAAPSQMADSGSCSSMTCRDEEVLFPEISARLSANGMAERRRGADRVAKVHRKSASENVAVGQIGSAASDRRNEALKEFYKANGSGSKDVGAASATYCIVISISVRAGTMPPPPRAARARKGIHVVAS